VLSVLLRYTDSDCPFVVVCPGVLFLWPLCCLFFFDLRILITSLWYLQTLRLLQLSYSMKQKHCCTLCRKRTNKTMTKGKSTNNDLQNVHIKVMINTNPPKNRGWTQVLRKGRHILLYYFIIVGFGCYKLKKGPFINILQWK
jgi:hypothetical protein